MEGVPPPAGCVLRGGQLTVPTDHDCAFGAPLGQVLAALGSAKIALVSLPEKGGPPTAAGDYAVPTMAALERAAAACFPTLVAGYDFKGSASQHDCAIRSPDCEMVGERKGEWSEPEKIEGTQWCRYWCGRVRATLTTLLLAATPTPTPIDVMSCKHGMYTTFAAGERIIFLISLTGGSVTQTEYKLLPGLIGSTLADLSTRELDLGRMHVFWLHFETAEQCIKALQGYGGVDMMTVQMSNAIGIPGSWTDGPHDSTWDLLHKVPGSWPDERREQLLSVADHIDMGQLNKRLHNAVAAGSILRVQELIQARADPNCRSGAMDSTCLHEAAWRLNADVVAMLITSGADKARANNCGYTPLEYLTSISKSYDRDDAGEVQRRIDATMELLS
jgi:hypothetical protein